MTTTNNLAAQASDEPMLSLDERRAAIEADAVRINAGRKPKFGDWMRNPWAGESNPQRDGMFVRAGRNTGRCNPGPWYEFTDGKGEFWQMNTKSVFFIDTPRATADVERYREGWQDGMQEAQELLSAEIADAARYQWLRNKNPQMLCSIGWSTAGGEFDDPDQVIDAAIAATKP